MSEYSRPGDSYDFVQLPTKESVSNQHPLDELNKEQLIVMVQGLTTMISSLREQVEAQNEALGILGSRLELAEMIVEEERKYDQKTSLLTADAFKEAVEDIIDLRDQHTNYGRRFRDTHMTNYLVFIDLDNFKALNDRLNNHVVDQEILLPAVEGILHAVRDDEDLVGRHGGDEFLVLLRNVDINEARVIAKRIQARINSVTIPQVHQSDESNSILGASIGVTECPLGTTYEDIFKQAHDAHLMSKESGAKNQIIFVDKAV